MSAYCERSDVYRWIPRGSVGNPGQLVSGVDTAHELLLLDGHGLELDDPVVFRAESGGTLPAPLVTGTTYYAIPASESTFRVATAAGGAAVNLTTAGANVVVIAELPWERWIEDASAEVESTLPAHAVPLVDVPAIVRAYTAGLVAERALAHAGISSAMLDARMERVRNEMREWRKKGVTIRGAVIPPASGLSIRSTREGADPRGWLHPLGDRYLP